MLPLIVHRRKVSSLQKERTCRQLAPVMDQIPTINYLRRWLQVHGRFVLMKLKKQDLTDEQR